MKQIVDKLNKIAKKINENVELSDRDLIIDSLDSITKAYGGTPNDSNLIVDKLEDIYNNIGSAPSGNIEITENTAEPLDISQYATATVNVAGGGGDDLATMEITFENVGAGTATVSIYNIKEGYLVKGTSVNANSTAECVAPIVFSPSPFPPVPDIYVVEFNGVRTPGENTLVNCTFDRNSETGDCSLIITDPTQPASATIPVNRGGIG